MTDYHEGVVMTTCATVRGSRRLAKLGVAISFGLITLSAAPAHATMFQKVEPYSGVDVQDFDACGLSIHDVFAFSGKVSVRSGLGNLTGAFFGHDNFSNLDTWTNTANGKFLTISADGLTHDVRATHVGGSIFQFVTNTVGQPFVMRSMSGAVVLRDRGAISFTYLFDSGGDAVPGGTFVENISVRVSGPHPGFFLDDPGFCALVVGLIG